MNQTLGTILVADDEPANRKVLGDMLTAGGYTVHLAEDGVEALQCCAEIEFDTLLLDVMMPNMTGLEVCRHLKSNSETEHIPIIIITALSERKDRLEAMQSGANDYLTKPVDLQDILFRVRNTVRLKRLSDEARENYRRLKETEQMRDEITAMMVHDMRGPLIGITGNLELAQMESRLDPEDAEYVEQARESAEDLVSPVNSLLDIGRLEKGKMPLALGMHDLNKVVGMAIKSLGSRKRKATINAEVGDGNMAYCDPNVMARVIANLVNNSIDFVPEDSGQIDIQVEAHGSFLKLRVTDNGSGIDAEDQPHIFDKFSQTKDSKRNGRPSAGLGLAFCKLAVESHGGAISVNSIKGQGCTFEIVLPGAAEMRAAA